MSRWRTTYCLDSSGGTGRSDASRTRSPGLDPQRATETSPGIVGFGAVVIYEDGVVAAVAKEGAAQLSNGRRCFNSALGLILALFETVKESIREAPYLLVLSIK